jgi:hypothetical protein
MKQITIHNLATSSALEVFDFISNHLLTQREKSAVAGDCLYKSPEGLKCAAGCLIPDADYTEDIERIIWNEVAKTYNVEKHHLDLIDRLQSVHDGLEEELWESELKRLRLKIFKK